MQCLVDIPGSPGLSLKGYRRRSRSEEEGRCVGVGKREGGETTVKMKYMRDEFI